MNATTDDYRTRFLQLALRVEALRFVETGLVLDNSVVDRAPAPMALVKHGSVIATAPDIPDYVAELLPLQDDSEGRQQPRQSA